MDRGKETKEGQRLKRQKKQTQSAGNAEKRCRPDEERGRKMRSGQGKTRKAQSRQEDAAQMRSGQGKARKAQSRQKDAAQMRSGQEDAKQMRSSQKSCPACPVAKKCGGCQLQGVPYEKQLEKKRAYVRACVGDVKVHPVIGMDDPTHYRNKVHAAFGRDRKNNVISGVYEEGSHRIVPVESCMIEEIGRAHV